VHEKNKHICVTKQDNNTLTTTSDRMHWYWYKPLWLQSGLSAELSSMTPLHVALSDAPVKQLATTWTVEGFSIPCFMACVWSSIWNYVLLLLEDQNLFISTGNGVSEFMYFISIGALSWRQFLSEYFMELWTYESNTKSSLSGPRTTPET
jgi:hypothetical protein